MTKPFHELRERLLLAGVAPRHAMRYIAELTDHLDDLRAEEEHAGSNKKDAEAAALLRLGGPHDLCKAMIEQRQFQSRSVRAPWAVFGLVPMMLVAGVYFISALILWSGWKIFIPNFDTPFIRIHGVAIFYFGVGRLLYFAGPILVGWSLGLIAIRQRLRALWPGFALTLIALMSGMAQIQARRTAFPAGSLHIRMNFSPGSSVHEILASGIYSVVIFSLGVLPYFTWRLWSSRDVPA